ISDRQALERVAVGGGHTAADAERVFEDDRRSGGEGSGGGFHGAAHCGNRTARDERVESQVRPSCPFDRLTALSRTYTSVSATTDYVIERTKATAEDAEQA